MRFGVYEVEAEIGRGGSGAVYRARGPEGTVAIKVLAKLDPERLARFAREVRLQESLGAEGGFVPVLAKDLSGEAPYLVLPFLSGGTLRSRLERGPLSVEETVALGRTLALSLGRAHALGIVHRDLKPGNVLFTAAGSPRIADLGLAKHWRRDVLGASASVMLSRSDQTLGTFGYMPPEQLADAAIVGPEADVFALGAILYECLAGKPAFQGETVLDLIAEVEACRPEPLRAIWPETPGWLAAVIERALAKNPRDRFADGSALAEALAEARPRPGRVGLALAVGAGAIVGLVVLASSLTSRRDASSVKPLPPLPASSMTPVVRGTASPGAGRDTTRARALAASAAEQLHRGDWDGAIAGYTEALRLDPMLGGTWANRGAARCKKGDWEDAIADFTAAIRLDPEDAGLWANRGMAHGQGRQWESAVADATEAIRLDPTLAEGWVTRGIVRDRKGDAKGAIADYERFLELGPDHPRSPEIRVRLQKLRAATKD